MAKLFISYKRETDGIKRLEDDMTSEGYEYWLDRNDISVGSESWKKEVIGAIEECSAFILCLTQEACNSENVKFEVSKALEFGKRIFPLILDKSLEIPAALAAFDLSSETHTEDFRIFDNWKEKFKRLIKSLKLYNIQPTGFSFLKCVMKFNEARMKQDYRVALEWLERLRQSGGCENGTIDCEFHENLVLQLMEAAAEEQYWQEIGDEYALLCDMVTYAPHSEVWNWLQDFLKHSYGFSDDKGIENKIREAVGIEPITLEFEPRGDQLYIGWRISQKAQKVSLTQTMLKRSFPDWLYGVSRYVDEKKVPFEVAETATWEFDRTMSSTVVNIPPEGRYIFHLSCEYLDQFRKPFWVEEPPFFFPLHKKFEDGF